MCVYMCIYIYIYIHTYDRSPAWIGGAAKGERSRGCRKCTSKFEGCPYLICSKSGLWNLKYEHIQHGHGRRS